MKIFDLGISSYKKVLSIQESILQGVAFDEKENTLLLVEHPPVITFGRNGGRENLHVSDDVLLSRGVEVLSSSRGGNVTCHYPGQLVAYPIFKVAKRPGGLKQFFHDVEEVIIRSLSDVDIISHRRDGFPGVWASGGKIASIGIGVKRWTTYHGLSLNVDRDTSLFNYITLCGLSDTKPTSVHAERGDESVTMEYMKERIVEHFRRVFENSRVAAGEAAPEPQL